MTNLTNTGEFTSECIHVLKDISFLGEHRTEKMDLYFPPERDRRGFSPAALLIHGGGWSGGDKATPRERNIGCNLAWAGYVCASINYQLAKPFERFLDRLKTAWPRNLQDCMRGVDFLRANAKKYRIDPDRIAVVGTSAGGHMASLLGILNGQVEFGLPQSDSRNVSWDVQAVVSMYGVHDIRMHSETRGLEISKEEEALCAEASPVNHLSAAAAPFLILHGTGDQVVPIHQSTSLSEKASLLGVDNELHLIEGGGHGFDLQPSQEDLRPRVIGFLDRYLKR